MLRFIGSIRKIKGLGIKYRIFFNSDIIFKDLFLLLKLFRILEVFVIGWEIIYNFL